VRTSAIEIAFRHPQAVVVGLQPGTVATRLSAPFVAADRTISPDESARRLLGALDALSPSDSGQLVDHQGTVIPP
jgi:hypothetical protein